MPYDPIDLWPGQTFPGEPPTLHLFPCDSPSPRGGVMILPGGGYGGLADHEGPVVARRFNAAGFDAAVLRYRLGTSGHRHPDMIHDAQRGIRLMRQHAAIRGKHIAVLGFSAGGHLASTLAVHCDRFACHDDDLHDTVSARPDAAVLCYPVIDLQDPANLHIGSRDNLLGANSSAESLELLSTHRHVTPKTPPTFLWHTADDKSVPMGNSLVFATACRSAGVPVELHVYESGEHGATLRDGIPDNDSWFDLAAAFIGRQFIKSTN